jgi:hypothetical protein
MATASRWLIVGMHRSGTSLLMKLLEEAGFHVGAPADFHPPTAHDPEGYREHLAVWQLDEEILAAAGAAWDRPQEFDATRLAPKVAESFVARATEFVERMDREAGDRRWVIKDPRLCLTLPLWLRALDAARETRPTRFVLPLRRPLEVARSLEARDELPLPAGLALWEAYHRAALAVLPLDGTATLSHADLQADPATSLRRLFEKLGEAPPVGPVSPPSSALHRQRASADDTAAWSWRGLREIEEALSRADGADRWQAARHPLSAPSRNALERHARAQASRRVQEEAHHRLSVTNEELSERLKAITAFEQRDREISAWNEQLTARLAEMEADARAAADRLAGIDRQLQESRTTLATRDALFDRARVALADARQALQDSAAGLAAGEAAIGELRRATLALLASRRVRWPESALAWALGPSPTGESFAQLDATATRTLLPRLAADQHRAAAEIAKIDGAEAALRRSGD